MNTILYFVEHERNIIRKMIDMDVQFNNLMEKEIKYDISINISQDDIPEEHRATYFNGLTKLRQEIENLKRNLNFGGIQHQIIGGGELKAYYNNNETRRYLMKKTHNTEMDYKIDEKLLDENSKIINRHAIKLLQLLKNYYYLMSDDEKKGINILIDSLKKNKLTDDNRRIIDDLAHVPKKYILEKTFENSKKNIFLNTSIDFLGLSALFSAISFTIKALSKKKKLDKNLKIKYDKLKHDKLKHDK